MSFTQQDLPKPSCQARRMEARELEAFLAFYTSLAYTAGV